MSDYTLDLAKIRPGDIVAFQVCQLRTVSRGEFYIDGFKNIGRYDIAAHSGKTYQSLTLIDPRRLTLDGKPCVRERFVIELGGVSGYHIFDTDTPGRPVVAWFRSKHEADAYVAEHNTRGTNNE